jgi:hypothetical protein
MENNISAFPNLFVKRVIQNHLPSIPINPNTAQNISRTAENVIFARDACRFAISLIRRPIDHVKGWVNQNF